VIIAAAIWAVVKRQVTDTTLPPGGAGGGTGFHQELMVKTSGLFA